MLDLELAPFPSRNRVGAHGKPAGELDLTQSESFTFTSQFRSVKARRRGVCGRRLLMEIEIRHIDRLAGALEVDSDYSSTVVEVEHHSWCGFNRLAIIRSLRQ